MDSLFNAGSSHFALALHVFVAAGCASAPMRPPVEVSVAYVGPDLDGDGVAGSFDQCPQTTEDLDMFQDNDGCPELDNDNDGIVDAFDECPEERETHNSYEDMDGCPDHLGPVLQVGDSVRVNAQILFEQDSARLTPRGDRAVQEIARAFAQYEALHQVAVQGHAIESEQGAARLAARRAEAVALMQYGVAVGYYAERDKAVT